MKRIATITLFSAFIGIAYSQSLNQTIKGKVVDRISQTPLPGASIIILETKPLQGTSADINGIYVINEVPIGRYSIKASYLGYEDLFISEVLIGSGKEVIVNFELKESVNNLKDILVSVSKKEPLNSMATLSVRQLSVEEASRYAGGMNDPARLASSFAGVSSNLSNNGIVIRGNAPKGLLWRMEGIEISNPCHFANVSTLGAGAITALSDLVISNSDFYTGAFPAEFGNALSGVFDIKLRSGNNEKRENTIQAGLSGLAASFEGPLLNGKQSSYLINYRYSIFDLLAPVLPPEMGKLRYQDISFKMSVLTKNAGTFSLWGIGALDFQGRNAIRDTALWESDTDKQGYNSHLFMNAIGLNNKMTIGEKTFVNTTLVSTGNGLSLDEKSYNDSQILIPDKKISTKTWKYSLTSVVNHKFNSRNSNKTGIIINQVHYNWDIQKYDTSLTSLERLVSEKGSSFQIQAFTQSKYEISKNISFNVGLHSQFFTLNNHYTFEPRAGITWRFRTNQQIGLAYGLHSQLELLNFYLARILTKSGVVEPNRNLDFSKAHHLVMSYDLSVSTNVHLKVEPYFQKLFNIPVVPGSYYSLQNLEAGIFFSDSLLNKGEGKNMGVDITLERFLNKGYYYLVTTSFFDSKYWGGDNIKHNSRFNRKYVINILGGKEWIIGEKGTNILNINAKFCLMGGDYMNPIDIESTYFNKDIIENVTNAFTVRKPASQVLSLSVTYRKNKPGYASLLEFNFINVLAYKEINSYYFDKTTNTIKQDINQLVIPNLSYKVEF